MVVSESHTRIVLQQIFVKGPSAKAGAPTDFLVRAVRVTSGNSLLLSAFVLALLLVVPVAVIAAGSLERSAEPRSEPRHMMFAFVASAASIVAGTFAAYAWIPAPVTLLKSAIYLTLFACAALSAWSGYRLLFKPGERTAQACLISTVGFVCAFMLSLSWPVFEAMLIPGIGLVMAALLDSVRHTARKVAYVAAVVLLFTSAGFKLEWPYGFTDWFEPSVMGATASSTLPEMRGFRLPRSEVDMIDGATAIIRSRSTPQDTIFTYPSMPIFYWLSGRWSPTYAGDHNIDACPDEVARQDARRLLRARPAVILYYRQQPERLQYEEMLWRGGRRSGQRDVIDAVESLVRGNKLAAAFPAPPTKLTLEVYVRD